MTYYLGRVGLYGTGTATSYVSSLAAAVVDNWTLTTVFAVLTIVLLTRTMLSYGDFAVTSLNQEPLVDRLDVDD